MLIRSSSSVTPDFNLLTLGESCFYVLGEEGRFALFDCGASFHIAPLEERLSSFGLSLSDLSVLFLTNLSPERLGGLPYLKMKNPDLQVLGSAAMQTRISDAAFAESLFEEDQELRTNFPSLPAKETLSLSEYKDLLRINRVFPDSETFSLNENIGVRCFFASGHTSESIAYYVVPHNFLIIDQCFGYFRGKELAAPGADLDLLEAVKLIDSFKDIELAALCLPFSGVLTGNLIRKHLANIVQNTDDLFNECKEASAAGIVDEEIYEAVQTSFYSSTYRDPLLRVVMDRTLEAVWKQILRAREQATS
jgi:glyoxylase-like metal-dependent hydrolase (beta-lactamase superfamily II)